MLSLKKCAAVFLFFSMACAVFHQKPAEAMGRRPKETFQIEMKVDFGPAGKTGFEDKKFWVEEGTTAKEAVSQVFPILSGKTCCSLRDILEINGVRVDPLKNRWWTCTLNGSKKFSPKTKKLRPGDRVEWVYVQNKQ